MSAQSLVPACVGLSSFICSSNPLLGVVRRKWTNRWTYLERSSRPTKCPALHELGFELTTLHDGLEKFPLLFLVFLLRQLTVSSLSVFTAKAPFEPLNSFSSSFCLRGLRLPVPFLCSLFSKSVTHSLPSPLSPKS